MKRKFYLTTLILISVSICIAQTAFITNSADNTVSVINLATNTVTTTIPVGTFPRGVSVSPDGTKAYITNAGSNSVSVINTGST